MGAHCGIVTFFTAFAMAATRSGAGPQHPPITVAFEYAFFGVHFALPQVAFSA